MATIPTGWHDDGSTLTAPNGMPVRLGFRDYILNHTWSPDNVPLSPEFHTDQVILHNPSCGAGQVQLFRDSVLWWTQAKGVINEQQLGNEINALRSALATAVTRVQTLKQQLKDAQAAAQAPSANETKYHEALKQVGALVIDTIGG